MAQFSHFVAVVFATAFTTSCRGSGRGNADNYTTLQGEIDGGNGAQLDLNGCTMANEESYTRLRQHPFFSWCTFSPQTEADADPETEAAPPSSSPISIPNQGEGLAIWCNGIVNLTLSLSQIMPYGGSNEFATAPISICVTNSSIPVFDFGEFLNLNRLSVLHSNVSNLVGVIPASLQALNLSHNAIKTLDPELFTNFLLYNDTFVNNTQGGEVETDSSEFGESESDPGEWDGESGEGNTKEKKNKNGGVLLDYKPKLEIMDLSHNKITELPHSIFYLDGLKSLLLSGNPLKCEFVWEKMWTWLEGDGGIIGSKGHLGDFNDAFCGVVEDVAVFHYKIRDLLQARKDFEETCAKVSKSLCSRCSLYALQREEYSSDFNPTASAFSYSHPHGGSSGGTSSKTWPTATSPSAIAAAAAAAAVAAGTSGGGEIGAPVSGPNHSRISISIKLDCSSMQLTELPSVPKQTWQLNISNNQIQDLSRLKDPMFSNLLILDANENQINLESLIGTPFIYKYTFLSLQNNTFSSVPTHFLSSLKSGWGQGVTFLGDNFIDCDDCSYLKEIKPLLIENSKRIRDVKDIFCRDMYSPDGSTMKRAVELQYSDVCRNTEVTDESSSEFYLFILIAVEVLLIVVVIGKVWHDQRTFRRTGVLPWCSEKMPRLPCDTMLESIKEPPHLPNSRPPGSVNSSSVNVNCPSSSGTNMAVPRPSSSIPSPGSTCMDEDKPITSSTPLVKFHKSVGQRVSRRSQNQYASPIEDDQMSFHRTSSV